MLVALFLRPVHADSVFVPWPMRHSRVVCGGTVDGINLDVRISIAGEVLKAESDSGRILIFVDLHKEGQVRWVISEVAKEKRTVDLYMGMTDGYVDMSSTTDNHTFNMSCQEIFY
jgi:hypothetical protein